MAAGDQQVRATRPTDRALVGRSAPLLVSCARRLRPEPQKSRPEWRRDGIPVARLARVLYRRFRGVHNDDPGPRRARESAIRRPMGGRCRLFAELTGLADLLAAIP